MVNVICNTTANWLNDIHVTCILYVKYKLMYVLNSLFYCTTPLCVFTLFLAAHDLSFLPVSYKAYILLALWFSQKPLCCHFFKYLKAKSLFIELLNWVIFIIFYWTQTSAVILNGTVDPNNFRPYASDPRNLIAISQDKYRVIHYVLLYFFGLLLLIK